MWSRILLKSLLKDFILHYFVSLYLQASLVVILTCPVLFQNTLGTHFISKHILYHLFHTVLLVFILHLLLQPVVVLCPKNTLCNLISSLLGNLKRKSVASGLSIWPYPLPTSTLYICFISAPAVLLQDLVIE